MLTSSAKVSVPDPKEIDLMLQGYGMVTAEFIYRRPDYQSILQTYVWQMYDLAPRFPKLHGFIDFWQTSLEGPLVYVRYTHQHLIAPSEWRKVDGEFRFN